MVQMHYGDGCCRAASLSCTMPAMLLADVHALNKLVLRLYRDGREVPLASFQAWALEQVQGVIAFDSAWW